METILSISGIASGTICIAFYLQWMIFYSRKKGYAISGLFRNSIYKPFKIEIGEEKSISEEDRKRLNQRRLYFYMFFVLAFLIALIANLPLVRGEG